MRAILLTLAISLPACSGLSQLADAKAPEATAERVGNALQAVRDAYLAVCSEPVAEAIKPKCDTAKGAFNAAQAEYKKVNDQL